MVSIEDL